ncbi:hypothetical protein K8B33_07750 [Alcanivorax sp. JB21]|uniref:hypothetical protein n=1 Tax=Alcanivorax limicola TaxID=2874102 RepID=UPI001CBB3EDA|nr:hypothetical protein [Alcanivorax limicola]MBZ2188986.1 hypothetical protein [Alcanivorax limicola]
MKKNTTVGLLAACSLFAVNLFAINESHATEEASYHPGWLDELMIIGVYTNDDNRFDGLFMRFWGSNRHSSNSNPGEGSYIYGELELGGFDTSGLLTSGALMGLGYQMGIPDQDLAFGFIGADINYRAFNVDGGDSDSDIALGLEVGLRAALNPDLLGEAIFRIDTNDFIDQPSLRIGGAYKRFYLSMTRFLDDGANRIQLGYTFEM